MSLIFLPFPTSCRGDRDLFLRCSASWVSCSAAICSCTTSASRSAPASGCLRLVRLQSPLARLFVVFPSIYAISRSISDVTLRITLSCNIHGVVDMRKRNGQKFMVACRTLRNPLRYLMYKGPNPIRNTRSGLLITTLPSSHHCPCSCAPSAIAFAFAFAFARLLFSPCLPFYPHSLSQLPGHYPAYEVCN